MVLALVVPAGAAQPLRTLTATPTHGLASATFRLTYTINAGCTGSASTVDFYWDAPFPNGYSLDRETLVSVGATCSATSKALVAPRGSDAPGAHEAYGYQDQGVPPGPDARTQASAVYRIDPPPSPSPSPSPKRTSSPSPSPSPTPCSATASPKSSASPKPSTSSSPKASASPSPSPKAGTASAAPSPCPSTHATAPQPGKHKPEPCIADPDLPGLCGEVARAAGALPSAESQPAQPPVDSTGFTFLMIIATGLAAGILLMLAGLFLHHRARRRPAPRARRGPVPG